jgi:hypothetical protein
MLAKESCASMSHVSDKPEIDVIPKSVTGGLAAA